MGVENSCTEKLIRQTRTAELKSIRKKMDFAVSVNDTLRNYEREHGKQVRYVYPKTSSQDNDFFEKYCSAKADEDCRADAPSVADLRPDDLNHLYQAIQTRLEQTKERYSTKKPKVKDQKEVQETNASTTLTQEPKAAEPIIDLEPPLSAALPDTRGIQGEPLGPSVSPIIKVNETSAPLPEKKLKTIMLDEYGFEKINTLLDGEAASAVSIASSPEALAKYAQSLKLSVGPGITAKIAEVKPCILETESGKQKLQVTGKISLKKGFVPFGSIPVSFSLVNGPEGRVILENPPEYQLPAHLKPWENKAQEAINNFDAHLMEGMGSLIGKPWKLTGLIIDHQEIVAGFQRVS